MADDPLPAHSIAEAKLYLLANACPRCSRGPVRSETKQVKTELGNTAALTLMSACDACGYQSDVRFTIPSTQAHEALGVINPTEKPSRILDLSQWVMLSTMLSESARNEPDKVRGRQLKLEAGLCLDEAFKFYTDEDNDLPPIEAFFSEHTLARFRESPHRFARDRLRTLRAAFPTGGRL